MSRPKEDGDNEILKVFSIYKRKGKEYYRVILI